MRFFHKFNSINYNFLGLVNGVLLYAKKKKKNTETIEYLQKYEYVLDSKKRIDTSKKEPHKIWQCWLQGKEKMPKIVKKCVQSVEKHHGNNVIFLDGNTLFDYIEVPDYIIDKYKKGIIPHANYSDICRLLLLAKYGGTWVDSTIYLTGKIPDDILYADFFAFRSIYTSFLHQIRDIEDFKLYSNSLNTVISVESPYFFGAKAGNEIINGVLNFLLEYWKKENRLYEYLIIDKIFIITLLHNEMLKEQFINMPQYYLEDVLLLQHALLEQFDEKLYQRIIDKTPIHKLTHKNLHRNPYKNSFLMKILEDSDKKPW